MSLKRTAVKMALAFAAVKGYQAFRQNGGVQGVKDTLARSSAGGGSGGLGGLLGGLSGTGSQSGGLGGILGALGGSAGTSGAGGMSGLLGGLAAMAGGGAAMAGGNQSQALAMAEAGPANEETAAVMIRAIGQAVRADGHIDPQERAVLDGMLDDAETAADRAAVNAALSEPIHPEALARDVPRGHEAEVYAAALTAIDPDSQAEQDFLQRFATALALAPTEVAQLHASAGKPI